MVDASRARQRVHDHAHHGASHGHLHGHGENRSLVPTLGRFQLIRPVVVGLVHGLAGSAAVALLVLATIQDTGTAVAYLVIFCIGVAAGMAVLTTLIGLPFMLSGAHSVQINRWLTIGSGILSLAFGLLLAYEIGFVGGLFTGDFNWEPS